MSTSNLTIVRYKFQQLQFLMLHDITSGKDNNYCVVYKKKIKKKRGGVSDSWLYVRKRGRGHSDAYCVQQGGWGGLKNGKKCVRN